MFEHNVTILKYRIGNKYHYKVMDKWDEPDEAKRLHYLMLASRYLANKFGAEYEQIFIKETIIV